MTRFYRYATWTAWGVVAMCLGAVVLVSLAAAFGTALAGAVIMLGVVIVGAVLIIAACGLASGAALLADLLLPDSLREWGKQRQGSRVGLQK